VSCCSRSDRLPWQSLVVASRLLLRWLGLHLQCSRKGTEKGLALGHAVQHLCPTSHVKTPAQLCSFSAIGMYEEQLVGGLNNRRAGWFSRKGGECRPMPLLP
jgi:hypothetical protein